MSFDVHTLLGDPDCSVCEGTGEMMVVTYNRRPTRDDTECCEAHTCQGCGEGVAPGATCPCWGDARLDNLGYALARAGEAAMAMGAAA